MNHSLELSEKIKPAIERIKDLLFLSPVLHKDETGMKINGKLRYAHVLCTDKLTFYAAHEKRGTEADKAMDVLPGYGGTLVHDHYKPLYSFACGHAECNARILRYLKGVCENEALYAPYAKRMSDFLVEANDKRKESKAKGIKRFGDAEVADFEKRYETILEEWLRMVGIEEAKRKGKNIKSKYKPEAEPLAKRLLKYKDEHLLFIRNFDVPFENNQAERDHRPLKTKLKVSGGFRSESGGDCYARIKSYISTLRKNKLDVFKGLSLAFSSHPVIL